MTLTAGNHATRSFCCHQRIFSKIYTGYFSLLLDNLNSILPTLDAIHCAKAISCSNTWTASEDAAPKSQAPARSYDVRSAALRLRVGQLSAGY